MGDIVKFSCKVRYRCFVKITDCFINIYLPNYQNALSYWQGKPMNNDRLILSSKSITVFMSYYTVSTALCTTAKPRQVTSLFKAMPQEIRIAVCLFVCLFVCCLMAHQHYLGH